MKMMRINVPRAKALAERRLGGHPIAVMEQVAVCELAIASTKALERVQAFIDYPYRDGELTPEQYAKVSEALRAIIAYE
jgi:hypothetical protein